ncbi:hypothetical protein RUM43_007911 [Polyplax serrata]|uniref:Nuclear nucleic acid-binding protein C1D n=1 Tax=Polyplax serrata TaxID=468196 RepID=A0AAN8PMV6_POLSC
MNENIDFGELSNDENFKQKILDLKKCMNDISGVLEVFLSRCNYEQLSLEDKVRYDLFLAFAINTIYWIYLRIKGTDPNNHEIKHQINRIREYMAKSKKIYEKKTIMPRLDQDAAKRFVRGGLWTPNSSSTNPQSQATGQYSNEDPCDSRKRKRDSDDD